MRGTTPETRQPGKVLLVQPRAPQPDLWLSMTRYTAGLATVLSPGSDVEVTSAAHVNMPAPFRGRFERYSGFDSLPYRWKKPADLVHFTDPYVAIHQGRFKVPRVVTVHDLITLDYVPWYPFAQGVWRGIFVRSLRAIQKAEGVVTPSEFTRQQLIERTPLDPARIQAVPVLVPDDISPPDPNGTDRLEGTILSIGTVARYKNLPLLLHALAQPELRAARLTRVGQPLPTQMQLLAERLGVADRIEFRGIVSDAELLKLLRSATVLAQPSLTEGFGMPVAEAMAAGLPVVTSNGGALPEVVAGGGRVVPFRQLSFHPKTDLDDAREFALALAEVLDDSALRTSMRAAGLLESERFRAPAVREKLLVAYTAASAVERDLRTG